MTQRTRRAAHVRELGAALAEVDDAELAYALDAITPSLLPPGLLFIRTSKTNTRQHGRIVTASYKGHLWARVELLSWDDDCVMAHALYDEAALLECEFFTDKFQWGSVVKVISADFRAEQKAQATS